MSQMSSLMVVTGSWGDRDQSEMSAARIEEEGREASIIKCTGTGTGAGLPVRTSVYSPMMSNLNWTPALSTMLMKRAILRGSGQHNFGFRLARWTCMRVIRPSRPAWMHHP